MIMTSKKSEAIRFYPWVGKNYDKKQSSKLLLIGESHYEKKKNDSKNLTKEVVKNFLKEKDMRTPFFKNVGFILNPKNVYTPWNNIAFANAIQICLSDAKSQPTDEEIATILPAFNEYLNLLKPSKVLILSRRLWEHWLWKCNWGSKASKHLKANGKQSQVWEYKYNGGNCLCMGIYHPSSIGFSPKSWKPLVDKFLYCT